MSSRKGQRTGFSVCCVTVFGAITVLLIIVASIVHADRANDLRLYLVQVVGLMGLLAGVYFSGRTFQSNRENQVTERFTHTIDLLGSDNLHVRVGAIYAMERLATTSSELRHAVCEVLAAYLREQATWHGSPGTQHSPMEHVPKLRADRQAAVSVLWRVQPGSGEGRPRLDLDGVDLQAADLRGARLQRASLFGAHLELANLSGAHLEGALLDFAHLERSWLEGAHLEGASLYGAHLKDVRISGAYLDGANLESADLDEAGSPPLL